MVVEPRWDTIDSDRTVLLLARTLTSAIRLVDALDLFRADFRVRPVFAIDEGTRSGSGVRELLRANGVRHIVPWTDLANGYDLAISASEQVDLDAVAATVIVLPHGVGFNKYVPDGTGKRIAGLPPASALRTGRVRLVLSHPDQHDQLLAVNPDVAGQTVVTGDPMFDRLRASVPLRQRYRDALDAGGRTVIMLTSTWGTESAFGHWRELPRRLLAELPSDEYRVVAAFHPNVWARHTPAVIRTWLGDCLDSGLRLLPPELGWQAGLVASDLVLGDHGSITLFAAALGKPVLLAAFGPDAEVVAGTPVAELGRLAARLDPARPLREQLDAATHDPRDFAAVTARSFAHQGEATDRLRAAVYRELRLPVPDDAALLRRFPDPRAEPHSSTAFDVRAAFSEPRQVTLTRYPRPVRRGVEPGAHLAVDVRCPDLRLAQAASVLTRGAVGRPDQARDWVDRALIEYPGAVIAAAAVPDGCVVAIRGRGLVTVRTDEPDGTALIASAVYSCLLAGVLADGPLIVRAGTRIVEAILR